MADESRESPKLSRRGEQALAALLQAPTIEAAAQTAGISERSLYRWLAREDFQKRYREAQKEVVETAIRDLQAATAAAVRALRANLDCDSPGARNTAALGLLSYAFKAREQEELAERIERLEALLRPKLKRA